MVTVVGICASRREGSYSTRAVGLALDAAATTGADIETIDLGAVEVPLYHPDREANDVVERLMETLREAAGVVIGSPVYHGSYSSTFKNFHDYCGFDEYEDTSVGLIATAGGGSYGSALDHLRTTVRGLHGWVVPQQVGIRSARTHFAEGELVTADLTGRIEELGRVVAEDARARATAGAMLAND